MGCVSRVHLLERASGALTTLKSLNVLKPTLRAGTSGRRVLESARGYRATSRDATAATLQDHCDLSRPPTLQRRDLLASVAGVSIAALLAPREALGAVDPALMQAFTDAFNAETFEEKEAAWSRAIDIAPENSAAWSNRSAHGQRSVARIAVAELCLLLRGTTRLQNQNWEGAVDDLTKAVELEGGVESCDPLVLNNLANAEAAIGNWEDARAKYLISSNAGGDIGTIALANYALASFQVDEVDTAKEFAERLLRRDPEFWVSTARGSADLQGSQIASSPAPGTH
eukprot:scaffold1536_cov397-Prasinococcus_capsulatus_cf.AAC.22